MSGFGDFTLGAGARAAVPLGDGQRYFGPGLRGLADIPGLRGLGGLRGMGNMSPTGQYGSAELQSKIAEALGQIGQLNQAIQAANYNSLLSQIQATGVQQAVSAAQSQVGSVLQAATQFSQNNATTLKAITVPPPVPSSYPISDAAWHNINDNIEPQIANQLQAVQSAGQALTGILAQAQSAAQNNLAQAQANCSAQPGMVWTPGSFGQPGTCSQSPQAAQAAQVVKSAISQANALNTAGASIGQLQQALSILQGASGAAAQAGMSDQLASAMAPIQSAIAMGQSASIGSQVDGAISQANQLAAGGNFNAALSLLQDQNLTAAAAQAGKSSTLASAVSAIVGQQGQFQSSLNAFNRGEQQGQSQCSGQPGMQWFPGSPPVGLTAGIPGQCSQSPQLQQAQAACANQGGNWTGNTCDLTAVNASSAQAQQAAQQAAQAAQLQLQIQAQQANACISKGGNWDGTSCDMTSVEAQQQMQQQQQQQSQLFQLLAPLFATNPQLAAQILSSQGGSMATSIPGGGGGGGFASSFNPGAVPETF